MRLNESDYNNTNQVKSYGYNNHVIIVIVSTLAFKPHKLMAAVTLATVCPSFTYSLCIGTTFLPLSCIRGPGVRLR